MKPRIAAISTLATLGALGLMAFANAKRARQAERANPPTGRFVVVDGVRLHFVEHGEGEPLVMFHGNGAMIQDFSSSGLIDLASEIHRVIVFDRPGFGHSTRPRRGVWTPAAQANLIHKALRKLGIEKAAFLGHSWGTSVAIQMALRHPGMVTSLVLASGYYFPTFRPGFLALSGPAIPLLGDIIRYTLAPIVSLAAWPLLLRKIFGPARTPEKFSAFPREMALRPSQLRAAAAETAILIPYAAAAQSEYGELSVPVFIIAGDKDAIVSFAQSRRLHREVPGSTLHRVRGGGHMIHQTHTRAVLATIKQAALAAAVPVRPVEVDALRNRTT